MRDNLNIKFAASREVGGYGGGGKEPGDGFFFGSAELKSEVLLGGRFRPIREEFNALTSRIQYRCTKRPAVESSYYSRKRIIITTTMRQSLTGH